MKLRLPKGTKDYFPREMKIKNKITKQLRSLFELYGGKELSTPTFEHTELLVFKYGEEEKLIYNLSSTDGDKYSLRYDLTVPLARILAQNREITRVKRFQIGDSYRRDQPVVSKGRLRQFTQADFDFVGETDLVLAEFDCLQMTDRFFKGMNIRQYKIRVSDRRILAAILKECSIKDENVCCVCSTIDKLDKKTWEELAGEFKQKGVSVEQVQKLRSLIEGTLDEVSKIEEARQPVEELRTLLSYCSELGVDNVVVDLSLARGLDYYTGVVFETVLDDALVGTVVGGGRYDKLVGSLVENAISLPCCGMSFGVDRLVSYILEREGAKDRMHAPTQLFIANAGEIDVKQKLILRNVLFDAGFSCDYMMKRKTKFVTQIGYCEKEGIDTMIVLGENELAKGEVKVKNIVKKTEACVKIAELCSYLKGILD